MLLHRKPRITHFYPKLFSDNFHQHPFAPSTVELAIENLLPRAEIEFAVGNGDHNFAPHHLSFYVRIGIVFAGIVVAILLDRFVGRYFFQPDTVIVMKAGFVVIDKYRRGNVHGIDEHKSFFYAALAKAILHLRGDVDEGYPCRRIKPDFFAIAFHGSAPSLSGSNEPSIKLRVSRQHQSQFHLPEMDSQLCSSKNSPDLYKRGNGKSPFVKGDLEE